MTYKSIKSFQSKQHKIEFWTISSDKPKSGHLIGCPKFGQDPVWLYKYESVWRTELHKHTEHLFFARFILFIIETNATKTPPKYLNKNTS